MSCSVKFLAPMRTGGPSEGATRSVVDASSPPPQAPKTSARTTAASRARMRFTASGARSHAWPLGPGGDHGREGEGEHAALPRAAGHPDAPAELVDDALADRQPDARAGVVLLAVQALEGLEDALRVV